MNDFELPAPIPKEQEDAFFEFPYKKESVEYLDHPSPVKSQGFWNVLVSRKTRYEFSELSTSKLSTILWHSAKVLSSKRTKSGFIWQHRPTPSAGGRHPIDILVFRPSERTLVHLYDPLSHALHRLSINNASLSDLIMYINEMVPLHQATILLFAAQVEKTSSKYHNPISLIYRDSGALLATLYFIAEALDLSCCGLGITGEPFLSQILESQGKVFGVGGCLVGGTKSQEAFS